MRHSDGHPVPGLADADGRVVGQFGRAEDLAAGHQEGPLARGTGSRTEPGDACRPMRRGSRLAPHQLNTIHRKPRRGRISGVAAVVKGLQEARRVLGEGFRRAGELIGVGGHGRVVLHDLRYAAVAPLDRDAPLAGRFDADGFVSFARAVVEELERKPEGLVGGVGRQAVLDGDVGGPCLHAESARSDGETDSGAELRQADLFTNLPLVIPRMAIQFTLQPETQSQQFRAGQIEAVAPTPGDRLEPEVLEEPARDRGRRSGRPRGCDCRSSRPAGGHSGPSEADHRYSNIMVSFSTSIRPSSHRAVGQIAQGGQGRGWARRRRRPPRRLPPLIERGRSQG